MQQSLLVQSPAVLKPVPLRDVAAVMFRHKRLLSLSFFAVFCLGIVVAALMPRKYESSLKLLAARERTDAVITADRDSGNRFVSEEISEAELSSEVEMLRTDDLLRAVVLQTGLAGGPRPTPTQVDRAMLRLKASLNIEPINKSNLIGVTYRSTDPRLAASVLNTLASLFLTKQLEVRRPTGQYAFFDQQAEQYKRRLAEIEQRMADARIVAPQAMKEKTLQQVAELKAGLAGTQAAIAEAQRRIATLAELKSGTPERLTTEMRKSDNPQLLQNLKGTLLTLSLKRDELLAKFQPSFRPVQDVERQIADTRAALAAEESKPVREESTNENTTFEWIRTEMAKAQADLQGLRGREAASQRILATYNDDLRKLNTNGIGEQDLQRDAASAEANYLLYSKKREEARISDELDQRKILNVLVVQAAAVPAIHVHQKKKMALLGMIVAILLSLGAVLVSDSFDPHFRSPEELESSLDIPVLAAIPSAHELTKLSWEPGAPLKGGSRAQTNGAILHPGGPNGRGESEY
jgi:uncharacterized protein involved in exopolysaccharide biosynthesis